MSALMFAIRHSCVSSGWIGITGLTSPLTVRVVGALLLIFALSAAPFGACRSLRARTRSVTPRRSGGR